MPVSAAMAAILDRVRVAREQAGISEAELEEQLLLGPGWIGRFESGESVPMIDVLLVILQRLGADPGEVFAGLELESGAEVQRSLSTVEDGPDLLLSFRYGSHDATYRLPKATLKQFEDVIRTLRNGLARLVNVKAGGEEFARAIKTDAVVKTFLKAVRTWRHANPSTCGGSWFIEPSVTPSITQQTLLGSIWNKAGSGQEAGR